MKPQKPERKGSKYIYRSGRFFAVRIGRGGPEIKMETLNGNLTISKTEEKS